MTYVLKSSVAVAPDESRGLESNAIIHLPAGLPLVEIPESEKRQLAPDHFVDGETDNDTEGRLLRLRVKSDKTPSDWRGPAAQERDEVQRRNLAAYLESHLHPHDPEELEAAHARAVEESEAEAAKTREAD